MVWLDAATFMYIPRRRSTCTGAECAVKQEEKLLSQRGQRVFGKYGGKLPETAEI